MHGEKIQCKLADKMRKKMSRWKILLSKCLVYQRKGFSELETEDCWSHFSSMSGFDCLGLAQVHFRWWSQYDKAGWLSLPEQNNNHWRTLFENINIYLICLLLWSEWNLWLVDASGDLNQNWSQKNRLWCQCHWKFFNVSSKSLKNVYLFPDCFHWTCALLNLLFHSSRSIWN